VVGSRLGLAVIEDSGLREIDVGSWSGLTRAEVSERFPEGFARWLDGEIGHDGETREQLTERVVAAVERIAAHHDGETILVVTHGGAIRALLRHAEGDPGDAIANCGTIGLELVDGVLAVRSD
jgi:broad specificity phosphatase PhoE